MINLLYYLLYTLDTLKKKTPPSIQSNCCKSYDPDYMAEFLVGKPEVVKDGFLHVLCVYLWCGTSSNNTSQALSWQTGGLWREIMSWEVHDVLLKSLWLDLENQMGLQGKRPFLSYCTSNTFEPQSRYLWEGRVVFVSHPGLDSWCTAGKPLCTADLKSWNSHDVTFFSTDLLPLLRGAFLALRF